MKVSNPLLRYHGAKWRLAPWITSYFPKHRIYVEPFGGSGAVLLRKEKSEVEVYNDLDKEIVNLFTVCRERGEELAQLVYLTPYSRSEFKKSFELSDDPVEQARRTIVRSFQGFGSGYVTAGPGSKSVSDNGFRIGWRVKGNNPHSHFCKLPNVVIDVIDRLRGVVIENTSYENIIKKNDTKDTLIYADPPYVSTERDRGNDYRYEFSEDDHINLAKILHETKGCVVVSGYRSALYDELYKGWLSFDCTSQTALNTKRVETIWIKGISPGGYLF